MKSIAVSHLHYQCTAFQLAFCYILGFGIPRDEQKAQRLLEKFQGYFNELRSRVKLIREDEPQRGFMNETLEEIGREGYVRHTPSRAGHGKSKEVEKMARIKEIQDIASVLGESHLAVRHLRHSLCAWLLDGELLNEAEVLALEDIRFLINQSTDLTTDTQTTANQDGQPTRPPTSDQIPGIIRSPVLNKLGTVDTLLSGALIRMVYTLVDIYMRQSHWSEAEYLSLQLGDYLKRLDHRPQILILLNSFKIGRIYEKQGRSREAEDIYRSTLDTCIDRLGQDYWLTIDVSISLLELYQRENHHWKDVSKLIEYVLSIALRKARNHDARYFRSLERETTEDQFLEVTSRMSSWDHLVMDASIRQIIKVMGVLAIRYRDVKQYEKAQSITQQMINISKKCLPVNAPVVYMLERQLGWCWCEQGRLKEAESQLMEVYEKSGRALGKTHEETLIAASNLAIVYLKQSRLIEAEMLMETTNEVQRKTLGADHPRTLAGACNLACVYKISKDTEKRKLAVALFKNTLGRQKSVLGEKHEHVLQSAEHLGNLYGEDGKYEEAEDIYRFLVTRRESLLGPDHPEVMRNKLILAMCLSYQGREQEATSLLECYSAATTRIYGDDSEKAIEGLAFLAQAYFREQRWEEEMMVNQRIVKKGILALGQDHPRVQGATARLKSRETRN